MPWNFLTTVYVSLVFHSLKIHSPKFTHIQTLENLSVWRNRQFQKQMVVTTMKREREIREKQHLKQCVWSVFIENCMRVCECSVNWPSKYIYVYIELNDLVFWAMCYSEYWYFTVLERRNSKKKKTTKIIIMLSTKLTGIF